MSTRANAHAVRSAVLAALLVCAAHARAQGADAPVTDPSAAPAAAGEPKGEPLPPPPAPPCVSTSAAPVEDPAGAEGAPPARVLSPLEACRALLARGQTLEARRCFLALTSHPEHGTSASAALGVVEAWDAAAPPPSAAAPPSPPSEAGDDVWASGTAEATIHGAVAGGGASFLLAAAAFSAARTSEKDSLGWLIAAPAAGAVGGAAGAYALTRGGRAAPGDIALAVSSMWMGAAQGFTLQLSVFENSNDVASVPLRFLTVLGGGALGLVGGLGVGAFADVTPGDVALANSAGLWGAVLSTFALQWVGFAVGGIELPAAALLIGAGGLVPWAATLALHPVLDVERAPTWLIEAGGAAGFLVGGAVVVFARSSDGIEGQTATALVGAATAAGVVVGATGAVLLSAAARGGPAEEVGE